MRHAQQCGGAIGHVGQVRGRIPGPADRAEQSHFSLPPENRLADRQPSAGGAGRRGVDVCGLHTMRAHLLEDLRQCQRIADGGDRPAGDAVPHERPAPLGAQLAGLCQQQIVQLGADRRVDDMNLGAHQVVEQQIALDVVVMRGPGEIEMAFQAELVARRRGLPAVVGLDARSPDEGIGLLLQGLAHQEFVVPRLVAAHDHAGAIVALDENARPLQTAGKAHSLLQRRRQMRQRDAWQASGEFPQFFRGQWRMCHEALHL